MTSSICQRQRPRQRQQSTLLLVLVLLLVLTQVQVQVEASLTYMLLKGTGSNCLSVDPIPGSKLAIQYHLPDLKIKQDLENGKLEEEMNTEGMDEAEKALLQRQREVAIKRARQGKDVSIAISQRTPFQADAGQRERPRNQREQPTEKEGTIDFESSPGGGPVQICVHSLFATKNDPYVVGLQVSQQVNTTAEQNEEINKEIQRGLLSEQLTDQVLGHLSAFSKEMVRAEGLVRTILASADVVKKEEAEFYEQSIKMEKGVRFWPMLQLVFLLVAGFVQIRHVLHWMRSKHIC